MNEGVGFFLMENGQKEPTNHAMAVIREAIHADYNRLGIRDGNEHKSKHTAVEEYRTQLKENTIRDYYNLTKRMIEDAKIIISRAIASLQLVLPTISKTYLLKTLVITSFQPVVSLQ